MFYSRRDVDGGRSICDCDEKAVRLSVLAPNINRHPKGCLKDENGEGGYSHFAFFRPLMRFPKKSLIRDSAAIFALQKSLLRRTKFLLRKKRFDYPFSYQT